MGFLFDFMYLKLPCSLLDDIILYSSTSAFVIVISGLDHLDTRVDNASLFSIGTFTKHCALLSTPGHSIGHFWRQN